MDCSPISNETNFSEADELTGRELSEKYYLLRKQFDDLSTAYEATKQELNDTCRSHQTALDEHILLTTKLESFQTEETKRGNELNTRILSLQEEISALQTERSETADKHANEIKKLELEIKNLKEKGALVGCAPERDNPQSSELKEVRAAIASCIHDSGALITALAEARGETAVWRFKVDELVTEIEEMRTAAEKRTEQLHAAAKREAAALAELAEVRAKLHQADNKNLKPHFAKGNSTVAKVEKKWQKMAKSLLQMQQSNIQLRRELAVKDMKIEALLENKRFMWDRMMDSYAGSVGEQAEEEDTESDEDGVPEPEVAAEPPPPVVAPSGSNSWMPGLLDRLKSECEFLEAQALLRGPSHADSVLHVRELQRKIAQVKAIAAKRAAASASASNHNN